MRKMYQRVAAADAKRYSGNPAADGERAAREEARRAQSGDFVSQKYGKLWKRELAEQERQARLAQDNGAIPRYEANLRAANEALEVIAQFLVAADTHPIAPCDWPAAGSMGKLAHDLGDIVEWLKTWQLR